MDKLPFGPGDLSVPDPDEKPDQDTSNSETSDDDTSAELPEQVSDFLEAMKEVAERKEQEEERKKQELYDGEEFDDGGTTFNEDLRAYDQTAYTRNETDYSAYRYNLQNSGYSGGAVGGRSTAKDPDGYLDANGSFWYDDEFNAANTSLGDDLDAASALDTPAGSAGTSGYGTGTGYGTGRRAGAGGGWNSSTWSGYGGAWSGGGGWMSSWYSGYSTVDRAIEGIHNHVGTFITHPDYRTLEVVPDMKSIEVDTIAAEAMSDDEREARDASDYYSSYSTDTSRSLVARIDSSLYEKLGIAEAQQHYIVDSISQVLATQQYADPALVTYLQGVEHVNTTSIPNVTREIITELMRANGLPLLVEQMPGWLKRVTAFRSVMYIGNPPNGDIPAAYLMYAVWERENIENIEHQDAVEAINKIEAILEDSKEYVEKALKRYKPGTKSYIADLDHRRRKSVTRISEILVEYITQFGAVGVIVKELVAMREHAIEARALIKKDPPEFLVKEKQETVEDYCRNSLPALIHDHNKTFIPNPATPTFVAHQDFPECPNRSLLPELKRNRVELTRKCLFHLQKIPLEIKKPGSLDNVTYYTNKVLERIADMLGAFNGEGGVGSSEKSIQDKYSGSGPGKPSKSGVNCTKHPEFHKKRVAHGSIDREFSLEDPAFDRPIEIFDATLEN